MEYQILNKKGTEIKNADNVGTGCQIKMQNGKTYTLIVWGDLDAAVPLEDAYTLEGLIKDAAVIVYEGCTHYAYLENLGQTISIIGSFVRS
mgnify:CR=1 FL=1